MDAFVPVVDTVRSLAPRVSCESVSWLFQRLSLRSRSRWREAASADNAGLMRTGQWGRSSDRQR